MLFDLRGSGRRRVVKIVYVTLAILMGGGLVLFGIGGSGALSGGLLDAITESSGGADDGSDRFQTLEQQAITKARQDPTAANWAAVARARFNLAQTGEYVDQATQNYTDAGAELLRSAGRAWDESVKLSDGTPDPRVASLMVQAYAGIGELDKAASAQEVIAEDRNSAGAYATLAQIAYQAGQTRKGDLAPTRRSSSPNRTCARRSRASSTRPSRPRFSSRSRTPRRTRRSPARRRLRVPNRSDRALQSLGRALVAQLAEQRTLNPKVPGSIPGGGTSRNRALGAVSSLWTPRRRSGRR